MGQRNFTESVVEQAAIEWFGALGYDYVAGPTLAPDGEAPERADWKTVLLEGRFRAALAKINRHLPAEALDEVARKILRGQSASVDDDNVAFHRHVMHGVELQVRRGDEARGDLAWLIDFDKPDNNDWLVVNQLTIHGPKHNRRPDIVVYLNGLPIAVLELKNPEDENATLRGAWRQLQTYREQVPELFRTNEILVVSDGTHAKVPCAHTLYLDKPMQGHSLMQAIARVNRVFRDKPSGLVVDYLGLAEQLRRAVGTYGGTGAGDRPGIPIDEALAVLREKFGVVKSMFHGHDYKGYFSTKPAERLSALAAAADFVLGLEDGKSRYLDAMAALNKAAGLALHLEGARHLRDEIGLFQAVESNLRKYAIGGSGKDSEELDAAIRQIVSGAITSGGVIDIFSAAGLKRPDISILSDEFLETVRNSPHRNLQIELLKKLLADEIKAQMRRNVVQARKFSELLEKTLLAYQNRTLEAAQVIAELIAMARDFRDTPKRHQALGLTEDELAFYDALASHGDVRNVMGDKLLAAIAHDLVQTIRQSVTIDWTQRESVRASMRSKVKRLLRKHGYPPDKQEAAVVTVIEQAEAVCRGVGGGVMERPNPAAARFRFHRALPRLAHCLENLKRGEVHDALRVADDRPEGPAR